MSFGRKGGANWVQAANVAQPDIDVAWKTHWAGPSERPESDERLTARAKRLKRQMVSLSERWRRWVPTADEVSWDSEHGCVNVQSPEAHHGVGIETTRTPE